MEKAPITLKVYKARVEAHEEQLSSMQTRITAAKNQLDSIHAETELANSKHNELMIDLKKQHQVINQAIEAANGGLRDVNKRLKIVNTEIEERERYKRAQEAQIEQLTTEGNERLLDLNDVVASLEHNNNQLKSDKLSLESEIDQLTLRKQNIEQEITDMDNRFAEERIRHEGQLNTIKDNLLRESEKLESVTREVDKKLLILKEKEESIVAQRDAMRLEKQQIQIDKQRLNSTKALYDDV